MLKGKKKVVILTGVLVALLILVNVLVFTFDDIFTSLANDYAIQDYIIDIDLTQDGRVNVHEKHVVKFDNRHKPWWNYYKNIDLTKYGSITLDTVKMKVDGKYYPLYATSIDFDDSINVANKIAYTGSAYYCNRNNMLELGVVTNEFEKGTRTIEFEYVLDNILLDINDASMFYYQIVPKANQVPIENVSTTITFPENSNKLKHYLHFDGVSYIKRVSNDKVTITANKVRPEMYVEVRMLLDRDNYTNLVPQASSINSASVIAEEKADIERAKNKHRLNTLILVADIIVGLGALATCIAFAIKDFIRKDRHDIKDAPVYLHEPPEDFDVEEAMPIYHYYDGEDDWWSNVISATIMDLVRRKYLMVIGGAKKKSASITILNNDRTDLKEYENIIMDMLSEASSGVAITMKQFEDWCESHYNRAASMIKSYKVECSKRAFLGKLVKKGGNKPSKRGLTIAIVGIAISLFTILEISPFVFFNMFLGLGGIILYFVDNLRFEPLSRAGEKYYAKFKAFAQYMLDFSSFDKKTIPEIVLWEEYLVWATGMGIADEVSKQLSIVYPEFREIYEGDIVDDTFVYWYLFSPRYSFNVMSVGGSMLHSINSVQALQVTSKVKSTISSGGGSGSGFSGGGGGFGGGGGMGAR